MLKGVNSVLYYASDLGKTAQFYEELGFEVEKSGDTVKARLGDFALAFVDKNKSVIQKEAQFEPKGMGVFVYVEVDDVDDYFKSLKENGIKTSSEPRDWPWGKREFAVKDPDGYKLIFYQPIK
ncbi:MAG: hypothetical protein UY26_C0003G0145 [Candidatus Jorgensenbacteria bacterium GW2011_GWA1_48_13]|uniref:VOC domain-containing protein n=2 Tax=Candidatus Joergenseniibacteriota TaxID=1752739 RepID=A0A0G1YJI3_9BACT|nr:MAG: hypothetical protein UY26_C0003G0145 [Candidatus Jorgensenbacteria bacterium GW2011_GWA1_48_13]KKU99026.1 MAG: hypothetical protein UY32_C0008G0017 [Candidatus Jorgensenbacteria bacterium GW2011_GWC1_48_8]KKW15102.1 MAG: hypothetical protein UY55_C0002G0160 [Candidatus Jorgensenbacteria bacterium GW2011_GWB1_50_10]